MSWRSIYLGKVLGRPLDLTDAEAAEDQRIRDEKTIALLSLSATSTDLTAEPLPCPQCGYDLRGLLELRCPECGTRYNPRQVFEIRRNLKRQLYEQATTTDLRAWFRTLIAGFRPSDFWMTRLPAHTVNPPRLLIYWLSTASPPLLLFLLVFFGRSALRGTPLIIHLTSSSSDFMLLILILTQWLLTIVMFGLLQLSAFLSPAGIRRIRVEYRTARVAIYSGDIFFWLGGVIMFVRLMAETPFGYVPGGSPNIALAGLLWTLLGISVLIWAVRIVIAFRDSMRMDDAAIVGAASVGLSLLVVWKIIEALAY